MVSLSFWWERWSDFVVGAMTEGKRLYSLNDGSIIHAQS